MQINKWKIFGYTVVTWFLFSILARILVELSYQAFTAPISIVSGQGVVWGWMSLFMGIYLATKFKEWIELVWGVVLFFICTLPVIGMFIGIGYFARAYVKLEKARWGEEPEYRRREEEERKAREVTEQGDEENAAQEEAHAAWEISQSQKILAVVLALGVLLVGYLAFAPGSNDAPELIETPTPDKEQTPEIAQAVSRTPALAPAADQGKTITNSIGMEFVLIPAGEFKMGSPSDEESIWDDEGPVHRVTIEKSLYMGRYEVTQKEWREVMGNNPSHFTGDDLPVEKVSWSDVQKFIRKLNEKEGTDKYRLPSEAEWEYACRADTTTRYSFGDGESKLGDYAWYDDNSGDKTHPVGKKKPNPWGLYDMHGNVWEWTQDAWHNDYGGAPTDGSAWENKDGAYRVFRGGSWDYFARFCRSAARHHFVPGLRDRSIGFRLLKETDAPEPSETVPLPTRTATPDVPPDSGVTQTVSQTPAPTPAADQEETITNSIGMEFMLIPAGEFEMGSPSDEEGRYSGEGPVHHVKIEKSFYMGRYEVTQKEWREVMGDNPSDSKGDDLPVETVSWDDVQEFIRKLNDKEGTDKYRLPSEAEWEYACRAGTTTRYSFGDSESKLGDYAWYTDNSGSETHPVGKKKPNPYGLYDMHGNVWEWVQDKYYSDYDGAPTDGSAWESGDGAFRVFRGGEWISDAGPCRSARRSRYVPGARDDFIGFRLLEEM